MVDLIFEFLGGEVLGWCAALDRGDGLIVSFGEALGRATTSTSP